MKKMRLLLGLFVCAILLFSCRKPNEGDDPGAWMATDPIHLVGECSVVGDLDLAVYTLTLNPGAVHAEQVQLEKVELVYYSGSQQSGDTVFGETHHVKILNDTVLHSVYSYTDTIWNLTPGTTYSYTLLVSDALFTDSTATKTFQTLPLERPVVKIDTVFLSGGHVNCHASVTAGWRYFLEDPDYTLSMFMGTTPMAIDQEVEQVELLYDSLVGHTAKKGFGCAVALGEDASLWFRAFVKDSWGQEAMSDTAQYVFSNQPHSVIVKHDQLGPVSFRLKGNAVQGTDDVALYRCGFCYGTMPTPTVNDMVVVSSSTQWGGYSCDVFDLEYSTTYYYRSFLQITDENGPIYYSAGSGQFTTEGEVVPLVVEMIDLADYYTNNMLPISLIEPTKVYVLAKIMNGALTDVREYGFLWRKKSAGEEELTLDNCLDHVIGLDVSQFPALLLVPGLPDLTGAFYKQLTDMESETEYELSAYIKKKEGGVTYSTPITLKMPGK